MGGNSHSTSMADKLTSTMQRCTQSRVTCSSRIRSSAPVASSSACCTCFCCSSCSRCCLRSYCVAVLRLLFAARALAMLLMAMPSVRLGGAGPTCFVHTATFSTTSLSNVGRMFDRASAAAAAAAAAAPAWPVRFSDGDGSAWERQQTSQQRESNSSRSRLTIRIVERLPCPVDNGVTLPSLRPRCSSCCRSPTTCVVCRCIRPQLALVLEWERERPRDRLRDMGSPPLMCVVDIFVFTFTAILTLKLKLKRFGCSCCCCCFCCGCSCCCCCCAAFSRQNIVNNLQSQLKISSERTTKNMRPYDACVCVCVWVCDVCVFADWAGF